MAFSSPAKRSSKSDREISRSRDSSCDLNGGKADWMNALLFGLMR